MLNSTFNLVKKATSVSHRNVPSSDASLLVWIDRGSVQKSIFDLTQTYLTFDLTLPNC